MREVKLNKITLAVAALFTSSLMVSEVSQAATNVNGKKN